MNDKEKGETWNWFESKFVKGGERELACFFVFTFLVEDENKTSFFLHLVRPFHIRGDKLERAVSN